MSVQVKLTDPQPQREEQLPEGLKRCPKCGKVVPDSNNCLYCGHWLGPSWVLEAKEATE